MFIDPPAAPTPPPTPAPARPRMGSGGSTGSGTDSPSAPTNLADIKSVITNLTGSEAIPTRTTQVPTRPTRAPIPTRAPQPAATAPPKTQAAQAAPTQPPATQPPAQAAQPSQRLNKYLAFHLGISRRQADDIIATKPITINGQPAQLGGRVAPGDVVAINGQPVGERAQHTYLAMHKPVGYVCSRRQQGKLPTIYSLLPANQHSLKPVGRLDANSSGLLLLTDDGDFAFRLTHPKFKKTKVYTVGLSSALAPLHQQMIADYGITLDDGTSQLGLTRLNDGRTRWRVTMQEGRNRQIRRTFAALGYQVTTLHRTQFGNYSLGSLQPGHTKQLRVGLK